MTATTESARESHTREHRTASALHELADLIASGHVPEPTFPGQSLKIEWCIQDASAVRLIAGRMDRPVTVNDQYTSTEIPIGDGSHEFPHALAYTAAVVLNVYADTPTEAV